MWTATRAPARRSTMQRISSPVLARASDRSDHAAPCNGPVTSLSTPLVGRDYGETVDGCRGTMLAVTKTATIPRTKDRLTVAMYAEPRLPVADRSQGHD